MLDGGDCARNFARHESFAATRALVIEQDAVACAQAVALAIIYGRPKGKNLCHAVRAARPERSLLGLRDGLRLAEHFAARGLVKPRSDFRFPDCFENPDGTDP